uniref:RING-type E3 ubiquitin transferase n=1 Tax=Wollemia nobilis TaxID=56998 RepID=A0A0C9QP68_9CONI
MASYEQEISQAITRIALAGDGAVLGFGLAVLAIRTWLKFRSNSKALVKIQGTFVSHISDLRSLLSREGDEEGNRTCGREAAETFVVVRGIVRPEVSVEGGERSPGDGVIVTPNSGDNAVVFQKTQTCLYNEWRGLFRWSADWRALFGGSLKEQVSTSIRKVPFVLTESDELKNLSHVHINLDDSRHPLPLTIVYQNLNPVQASPYTVFQAIFGRGYPVGLLDEEKILPPGKEITAIGHLCLTHDGHPCIKSCKWIPCFLSDLTKDQLVQEIATGRTVLFWSGIVLSTAAIGVLSYAAFRNWQKWREWRQQRQLLHSREEPNMSIVLDEESGDVPDGQLCVVCLMRRRRSAFIPCGHHVCCPRCANLVERESNPKCPVCRQDVRNSVRIYDS